MGKVIRKNKQGVQRIRARDIVPGDLVEISGIILFELLDYVQNQICFGILMLPIGFYSSLKAKYNSL